MNTRRKRLLVIALAVVLVSAGAVSVQRAKSRALAAEETHVTDSLEGASCLQDWGTSEGTVARSASVVGVTSGGVRVSVTLPYAYTTEVDGESVHADTASNAVYVVTLAGARRASGGDISPC